MKIREGEVWNEDEHPCPHGYGWHHLVKHVGPSFVTVERWYWNLRKHAKTLSIRRKNFRNLHLASQHLTSCTRCMEDASPTDLRLKIHDLEALLRAHPDEPGAEWTRQLVNRLQEIAEDKETHP